MFDIHEEEADYLKKKYLHRRKVKIYRDKGECVCIPFSRFRLLFSLGLHDSLYCCIQGTVIFSCLYDLVVN
jgi:hypothetical protein